MSKIVLTGIKPTGQPHLGNFAGMIRPMIELVNAAEEGDKVLMFIANHHALNGLQEKSKLKEYTYDLLASLVALGLDPEKVVLFKQSDIPQVFELNSILMNYTPKGLMNRAHAYKATVDQAMLGDKNILENFTSLLRSFIDKTDGKIDSKESLEELALLGVDFYKEINRVDAGINMGLYTYPVLMAADILVYGSHIVPVGKDQIQHVEIARDIAGSFNHIYGDTLVLPNYQVQKDLESIPGLDGRKMSKSYGNTIPLFGTESELKKAIMRIVTNSKTPEEPKDIDDYRTIRDLYRLFVTEDKVVELEEAFQKGGLGYGDAKKMLLDVANAYLSAPRERYHALLKDRKELDAILEKGAEQARYLAEKHMRKVRKRLGF